MAVKVQTREVSVKEWVYDFVTAPLFQTVAESVFPSADLKETFGFLLDARIPDVNIQILVGALEFFHANADGGAGLQIKAGLETNAAGTAIEHLGVIALCLIKI